MAIDGRTMNVALTDHWEGFIRQLITAGRFNNASEVVRAALRKLQETEGEFFPPGSLKHLYTKEDNAAETKLARPGCWASTGRRCMKRSFDINSERKGLARKSRA